MKISAKNRKIQTSNINDLDYKGQISNSGDFIILLLLEAKLILLMSSYKDYYVVLHI
jgi:hypothetical protein